MKPEIRSSAPTLGIAVAGDPRYRPSPWLKQRALLDASLLHAE